MWHEAHHTRGLKGRLLEFSPDKPLKCSSETTSRYGNFGMGQVHTKHVEGASHRGNAIVLLFVGMVGGIQKYRVVGLVHRLHEERGTGGSRFTWRKCTW